MQTIIQQLDRAFRTAIQQAFGLDADPLIAVAANDKFGDYQSNAAMGLAKALTEKTGQKTNPRAVAEQIKARLDLGGMASELSIAGPGFINVRLSPDYLAATLAEASDQRLGIEKAGHPQTVVIDYSGPNIAKQMHVGHLRSTIIGDAIARVLEFAGHNVIRQNHLGDWGTQFGRVVLAMWYEAVFTRTGNAEKLHELMARLDVAMDQLAQRLEVEEDERPAKEAFAAAVATIVRDIAPDHQRFIEMDPEGEKLFRPSLLEDWIDLEELERAYVFVSALTDNPQAQEVSIRHPRHGARTLAELPRLTTTFIQNPDLPQNEQEHLAWVKARSVTLDACKEIYQRLGVQLADAGIQREPLERGESFYNPFLRDVVKELKAAGLAAESQGATVVPVEGFEAPLMIEKSGGGFLYGTTDLAAVRYRVGTLHANRVLYFVDARQSQHFAQVFAIAKKAGWAQDATLEHAAFGTMLGEDGKPFKTRSGGVVKLAELLDEAEVRAYALVKEKNPQLPEAQLRAIAAGVGIGGVKYSDLSKDRTSDYVFSFDKMLAMDGNTAPYMQYAHARLRSIFRRAAERDISPTSDDIQLESSYELALAKHILRLPEILETVARELKPHHLCNYLYELATRFSGFFENCPVLQSEDPLRSSRLKLCELTARTLALSLDLLGIGHPEQM